MVSQPFVMEAPVIEVPERGLKKATYRCARAGLASRTIRLLRFDGLKLRTRIRHLGRREAFPSCDRLHLGSGSRRIRGWLNADVAGSDCDIDFTRPLPWKDGSFSAVVSQHVIEHLDLFEELPLLLAELRRVLRADGDVWLSCPNMEKICRLYVEGRSAELVKDRQTREPGYSTYGAPPQQIVNDAFHQWGEHKNLFDFGMAEWALQQAGFVGVRQVCEADLLNRFPGFPARGDDLHTLYVTAQIPYTV
jgi:predicted SAM-dependent methyltransferase